MKELYRSVSMDEGRINVIEHSNGVPIVVKKTTEREISNTTAMERHLHGLQTLEYKYQHYQVTTPKIIFWNKAIGTLGLELREGENLEALLSTVEENRTQTVDFVCDLFNWMKDTGTFWRGAAPRHIVIDSDQQNIFLLDFERPVTLKQDGFKDKEFNEMLRGLVHEEFCAFLFEDEQQAVFPSIWDIENPEETIPLATIHGKRIRLLLENMFDSKDSIQTKNLLMVYRFMSSVVTPYFIEGRAFYPLKAIDKKVRGAENYVNTVLLLSDMDKSQWPEYLEYGIS